MGTVKKEDDAKDIGDRRGIANGKIVPLQKACDAPRTVRWEFVESWGDDVIGRVPPTPDWLLTRTEPEGRVGALRAAKTAMIAAAGGVGKTTSLIALALSIATGRRWLDTFDVARPGHVAVLFGEEDRDELQRKLHWGARALDLTDAEVRLAASRIMAVPLAGQPCALVDDGDGAVQADFLGELRGALDARGVDWRCVILDPLSRFGGAETEVANSAATRFVQALESITEVRGRPAVIVAHHVPKVARAGGARPDATFARGASALVDGVRWVGVLAPDAKRPDAVQLSIQKSNYTRHFAPVTLLRGPGGALRAATPDELASSASPDEGPW